MRLIDADWIVQRLEAWQDQLAETYGENDEYVLCIGEVLMKIDDTPTVNVPDIKVGEWKGKPIAGYSTVRCSECGDVFMENTGKWNYCPNCGAKMDGVEE